MSERIEFIRLATTDGANIRELCRRFAISPKTGYKWIGRYREHGGNIEAIEDRSRRPHTSPRRTPLELECAILGVRDAHQAWGGRKIHQRLLDQGHHASVPSPSTITAILHRTGRIASEDSDKHTAWRRFEAPAPNLLWQMDFKGHFPLMNSRCERCHPLTILDDHSRYAVGLFACERETHPVVQQHLTTVFRRYGLPLRMLMDNGQPWGTRESYRYTTLTVWLIRLGIHVSHARVCHPQTTGKDERFHRTLQAELIKRTTFTDLIDCQRHFDRWRAAYNCERPHQALNMNAPATRYRVSPRPFPNQLPPIEYGTDDMVRIVQSKGEIYFRNRVFVIGKAFHRLPVALRPTASTDGVFDVFFCYEHVAQINLHHADDSLS
jgi:transposase InsO family protein